MITKKQKEFIDIMLHNRNDKLSTYSISETTPMNDADTIIQVLLSKNSPMLETLLNGRFKEYFTSTN